MAEEKKVQFNAIKNFLNRYTRSQKIFRGSIFILVILGIILIISLASTLYYGVLFSNLSAKDSGLIIEQLKAKRVPYKLTGGGSTIEVPEDQVAELRLQLAAAGLPEGGGVGFEIFDKTSLSTTDFVQNINYIRAIEGELARTISQMREVSMAKVHISLPKPSVFIEEQQEAKASIVLGLRPGAQVAGTLVPAILHLTAQSIEGLKPGNIAIVDLYGNLLSRPRDGNEDVFTDLTTNQLAYQKNLETSLSRKVISLLEPYVGPGRVRTDVKLKLNFDKVETTEEKVDPESIAKVSEKSEAATGGGTEGGTSSPSKSKSEKSLINYEVSKTVTHLTKPVGEIQQLSMAIVVDDALEVRRQSGELIKQTRKRTAEELDSIRKIAQAAVGFNSQRGDVLEVANLPFDTSAETISEHFQEEKALKNLEKTALKVGLPIAIIIALLVLLFRFTKPLFKKINEMARASRGLKPEDIEFRRIDSERISALQEAKDEAEIERELIEKYRIPKTTRKMGIIRAKVKKFADENIDEAASLVKSFLIGD